MLAFEPQFVGQFDPIEALGVQSTVHERVREPFSTGRRISQPQANDASAESPFAAAVRELDELISAAGSVSADLAEEVQEEKPQAAPGERATQSSLVRELFAVYSRQQPEFTARPVEQQALSNLQQLRNLVDLLA
jgi:hypothetical protein